MLGKLFLVSGTAMSLASLIVADQCETRLFAIAAVVTGVVTVALDQRVKGALNETVRATMGLGLSAAAISLIVVPLGGTWTNVYVGLVLAAILCADVRFSRGSLSKRTRSSPDPPLQ